MLWEGCRAGQCVYTTGGYPLRANAPNPNSLYAIVPYSVLGNTSIAIYEPLVVT